MDKREKVIKGLECCINEERAEPDCEHCPYGEIMGTCLNLYKLHGDALALLKAQEPIEARLHLCESCTKQYPDCNSDYIEFGCGFGHDNVIGCDAYTNRWAVDHDCQREYEAATEMTEYCERYEPTYNSEDGSL